MVHWILHLELEFPVEEKDVEKQFVGDIKEEAKGLRAGASPVRSEIWRISDVSENLERNAEGGDHL